MARQAQGLAGIGFIAGDQSESTARRGRSGSDRSGTDFRPGPGPGPTVAGWRGRERGGRRNQIGEASGTASSGQVFPWVCWQNRTASSLSVCKGVNREQDYQEGSRTDQQLYSCEFHA